MFSSIVYRTLYEQTKPLSISYMYLHCHTGDNIYIGKSSLYDLIPLITLSNANIQYKQIKYDADNIDKSLAYKT